MGPCKSRDGAPILGPSISIPVSIFGPWISNPFPGISNFGFFISIPASIVGSWISREGTPIFGPWISNPASIFNIFQYFLNLFPSNYVKF